MELPGAQRDELPQQQFHRLFVDFCRKALNHRGMPARTSAVSYLRVSGKGQIEGDGFDRQREAVNRFAEAGGFEIVQEYRDEGVSGTRELSDRPGLAALLDRIESPGCGWSSSRAPTGWRET
jgi:hypothetical protein